MHLTDLPNELLKKITQYLTPNDYMNLHGTCRLLYSKRMPYNFQHPTEALDIFLHNAPLDMLEGLVITDWTEEAVVAAFARGLQVCHDLIRNGKVSEGQYLIDCAYAPPGISEFSNYRNNTEETLLTVCAMYGHTDLIEALLDHRFRIDDENNLGMTPLGCAIAARQADACRLLIQRGANTDHVTNALSAIHLAAGHGTPEILQMLFNAGEDVNLGEGEETPLHKAAYYGTVENVQWLLEHGADLWSRGRDNQSVLDFSMYKQDPEMFDHMLQRCLESNAPEYWKEDALTHAAQARNYSACQKLLDLGANVNGNPDSAETPLFQSVYVRHCRPWQEDIFNLLMEHDADLYVGDASKECVLKSAAASNLTHIMEALIKRDPKIVQWSCREGCLGSLHAAVWYGNVEACQLLLKYGVDINVTDQDGRTAMMHAAYIYSEKMRILLMESGADLQIKDNDGWTVMEFAIYKRDKQFIQQLRERSMQLPTEIPDTAIYHRFVRGAELMDWLRQNF